MDAHLASGLEDMRAVVPEAEGFDDFYLGRFLRARDYDASAAAEMLRNHIKWLETVEFLPSDDPRMKWLSSLGLFEMLDKDKHGNLVMYLVFSQWNAQKRNLDASLQCMLSVAQQLITQHKKLALTVVIDMEGFGYRNRDYKLAKLATPVFQDNFPNMLGERCFFINAPGLVDAVWRVVRHLLDPETREKFVFVKTEEEIRDMHALLYKHQIPKSLGGTYVPKQRVDVFNDELVAQPDPLLVGLDSPNLAVRNKSMAELMEKETELFNKA